APEADANAPVPEPLGAIGTACVTCHLTGDAVLAAPHAARPLSRAPAQGGAASGPTPRAREAAPHRVERDARFAGADACAGCHECDFPEFGVRRPVERMQATIAEHRASAYASFACADCHMPRVDGPRGPHRSHAFAASRSVETIRGAASVRAERRSPTAIRL